MNWKNSPTSFHWGPVHGAVSFHVFTDNNFTSEHVTILAVARVHIAENRIPRKAGPSSELWNNKDFQSRANRCMGDGNGFPSEQVWTGLGESPRDPWLNNGIMGSGYMGIP